MAKNISAVSTLLIVIFGMVAQQVQAASGQTEQGATLYQRCSACHMTSGVGVAGMFPPLIDRIGPLAQSPLGREYLILVVDKGMRGQIQVGKDQYTGFMPAQGPGLGDEGIATVLNYILTTFNASHLPETWSAFKASEVSQVRDKYAGEGNNELHQLREKVF